MTGRTIFQIIFFIGFMPGFLIFITMFIFTVPIFTKEIENNRRSKKKNTGDFSRREYNEDDYWEEVDYDTGEIITNTGPTIRHPKNRDRAHSGSVERFHDGVG